MSLRYRLLAYVIGLHLVFFAFTVALYRDNPKLFLCLEIFLLISLAGGCYLIKQALEPLAYTQRFRDLLQDQNYAGRLHQVKDAELGELVHQFNTMLDALYKERIELGEQRGFLDRLLEATPSAVLAFDFDGRISLLNASAATLLGLEDPIGKPLAYWIQDTGKLSKKPATSEHVHSLSLLTQLEALQLGESNLITTPDGRRYRGQRGQFYDRGFSRQFLLIEEMTAELESSELATYEKLIRVLAHEVNNTVAATGSVLDSLLYYSSQLIPQDSKDFTTAIVAVKRRNVSLGEFIERFTRVVKMPAPDLRPTAITQTMDDIAWMNREQCRTRGIRLEWTRRDEVPALAMDNQLIEQALLNIVKNAIEAVSTTMEENAASEGSIRLELANEAEGVRLSVIDSGKRLGDTPSQQLFAPFFSTKKGGQGIGLMFVKEVLNRHGFPYRLATNDLGETQFDIWFHTRQP